MQGGAQGMYKINVTPAELEILRKLPAVDATSIQREIADSSESIMMFPYYDNERKWSRDNYGPVWIPQKGASITLTPENLPMFKREIETYEHNTFEERNGKYFINGAETNSYTFKYDYYWMMGDNRHQSQDSRFWGFVPETHIVGKASMIWFSAENGVRWNRLFRSIR